MAVGECPFDAVDPYYYALLKYRKRQFAECCDACTVILDKTPYDQAVWSLKTRALTEQVYIDETEVEDEGIAEALLDDNAIATVARPGTSLKAPGTGVGALSKGVVPSGAAGRLQTGFARPGTNSGRPSTMEQALRTARTARSARPISSTTGRYVRLGTASMVSSADGPFIHIARLNFQKYGAEQRLAKTLFEYIFYHENDVRNALELASVATKVVDYDDWWWKVQIAKCYYRMGLYRDAEKQLKSAHNTQAMTEIFLYLNKLYCRMDQPMSAIDVIKLAIPQQPNEPALFTAMARIYDQLNQTEESLQFYRTVLAMDSTHIEAIACLATYHFYTDQPEVALRYYRRLLQLGVYNAELFNNTGLCCFYAQQWDMTLNCFERAIKLASDDLLVADIWYNIGHVALGIGDISLAIDCFKLTLSSNHDHAEAYNNLGVLEHKKSNYEMARSYLQAATSLGANMYEPHYNFAVLSDQIGDLQNSFNSAKKACDNFADHVNSKELLRQLTKHFSML